MKLKDILDREIEPGDLLSVSSYNYNYIAIASHYTKNNKLVFRILRNMNFGKPLTLEDLKSKNFKTVWSGWTGMSRARIVILVKNFSNG